MTASDSRVRRRLPLVLAALFFLSPVAATAAEFCVATTLALQNAMQQFANGDEDTVIRLRTGTYSFPIDTVNEDARLTLAGGYTDAGCAARTLDPAATVLRPFGGGNPFLVASGVEIGSVTFRDFTGSLTFSAQGSALFGDGDLRLTRTRVEGPLPLGLQLNAHRVYLNETIVTGSGSDNHFTGRCAVNIHGMDSGGDLVAIQHSVVSGNPAYGVCIGSSFANEDDGFQVWLDNNIFFANAMSLSIEQTSRHVRRNNVIDGNVFEYGAADPGASGGNSTANPLFVNAGGGDFRLQNASPAINSGRTTTFAGLPQYDIVGNPRWVGPAPDRGAYESAIDGTETLIVTQVGDSVSPIVSGTLRWAIQQANASQNHSAIRFDIPGACPRIIVLENSLPPITSPVTIAGYTQPGSSPNSNDGGLHGQGSNATICVRIAGNGSAHGLRIPQSAGSLGRLNLSGVSLGDFTQAAIALEAGNGSLIAGNVVNVGQPIGIFVSGSAEDTQIGGPDPWQKNVIQAGGYGIALNPPSRRSIVENNLVGLDADGNGALRGNDVGIGISANDNTVRGNAIAGNGSGVSIFGGSRNRIAGNSFGLKVGFVGACGIPPLPACPPRDLPNTAHGVLIQGAANDNRIENNTIAHSGQSGIRATGGLRNAFAGNPVWNSGGLGIDLNDAGPDPVDNDGASGAFDLANRGLNAPVFLNAQGQARRGVLEGALFSTNGQYMLEAWVSPTCDNAHRPMRRLAGYGSVQIADAAPGDSAFGVFSMNLTAMNGAGSLVGQFITVLATEFTANGLANTSEASVCVPYTQSEDLFSDGFE